jgi:hypothetical protein
MVCILDKFIKMVDSILESTESATMTIQSSKDRFWMGWDQDSVDRLRMMAVAM